MKFYKSWGATHKPLSKMMGKRNIPVAWERVGSQVWVLYVQFKESHGYGGWQINPSKLTGTDVKSGVNGMLTKGNVPFGVCITGTQFVGLYLSK